MKKIHNQLKKRRLELGLKQEDMMNRVGMSRQQYQRLESKGNPRTDTLELVAKGLKLELLLIPQEKLHAVQAVLHSEEDDRNEGTSLENDPWHNMLLDDNLSDEKE